jgi:hypothetical protein
VPRRRRPGVYPAPNEELTVPNQPNQVWTVDFKGWFLLGNGQRCDPLTVCDRYSHYVLEETEGVMLYLLPLDLGRRGD